MPFVLGILVLATAIWAVVYLRWTGLFGGCIAVLLTGICLGHSFYNVDVGPIPVTADRALIGFVAITFLLQRQLGLTQRVSLDRGDWAMIAFMVILGISTFTHDWRADGFRTASHLLFFFVLPFGLYWIARATTTTERGLTAAYTTFAILGLYLAVTGIAEKLGISSIVFPKYIASPEHWEFFGRARGPLLNPVANGILLCLGMCSTLMLWPRLKRAKQLMVLGTMPFYCAGIFCTMTRSVWLGAAAAISILVGLALPRNWRYATFAALILVGGATVALKWSDMQSFKRDKFVSVSDMERSASLRPILATVAWKMFCDQPILGCGLGQYRNASLVHFSDRSSELPLQVARGYVQHNVLLALLTENGILGAGLFSLLCGIWVGYGWSLWKGKQRNLPTRQWGLLQLSLLSVFLINGMFHDVSIMPMMNMVLFFVVGTGRGALNAPTSLGVPIPTHVGGSRHSDPVRRAMA